jgi:hypothetical protein
MNAFQIFSSHLPLIYITMKRNENIITMAVLIGLVALTFFIYNYFDSNKIDYRALLASIISLSVAGYFLTRGKFRV